MDDLRALEEIGHLPTTASSTSHANGNGCAAAGGCSTIQSGPRSSPLRLRLSRVLAAGHRPIRIGRGVLGNDHGAGSPAFGRFARSGAADRGAGLLLPGPSRSTDTVRAGRRLFREARCAAWQAALLVRRLGARLVPRGAGATAAPPRGGSAPTRRAAHRARGRHRERASGITPAFAGPRDPPPDGPRTGPGAAARGVASRATGMVARLWPRGRSQWRTNPTRHRSSGGLDLEALHGHARHATGRSGRPGLGRRREPTPPGRAPRPIARWAAGTGHPAPTPIPPLGLAAPR